MSPRSVQIWFQNRRQRLLKNSTPRNQQEAAWAQRSDGANGESQAGSPCRVELMPSPRETSSEGSQSGGGSGDDESANLQNGHNRASFPPLHEQHPYPVMAFLAKNLSAAIQYEAEAGARLRTAETSALVALN